MPARIVAFSGNTHRPSRTRTLVEAVAAELSRQRPIDLKVYDLVDAGTGIAVASRSALPLPAARIVEAIETADALIIGSPVYKGSYAGLFKHLIDFVAPEALIGKPVVLTATGGGPRHALVVEHSLRPALRFLLGADHADRRLCRRHRNRRGPGRRRDRPCPRGAGRRGTRPAPRRRAGCRGAVGDGRGALR
ncbi:MsuE subfamily FMN reductase [Methylorubrum extorquens]|nr:MsuE subfamily FMN reductase [Methylorubrum extorquens]